MRKQFICCIDLDDTIADTSKIMVEYAIRFNKEHFGRTGEFVNDGRYHDHLYFARLLNWNIDDLQLFFEMYYKEIINLIEVKNGVAVAINAMHEMGVRIIIITARRENENGAITAITENWLRRNGIYYDRLIMNSLDKKYDAQNIGCHIFIDDSEENCSRVSELEGTRVIMVNTDFNRNLTVHNNQIYRADSWKDIYLKLQEWGCLGLLMYPNNDDF